MALILKQQTEKLVERAVKFKNGSVTQKLNLSYAVIPTKLAAQLVDRHTDDVVKIEEGETLTDVESLERKQAWLKECLLKNNLLKSWDVYLAEDDKKAADINEKSLDAIFEIGAIFNEFYKDFFDYITKVARGESATEQMAEIKNYMKSGLIGKNSAT